MVLEEHESALQWPHRFQYAYNALLAGDLGKAHAGLARLDEPPDDTGRRARDKVQRMMARADAARAVTPLDERDLRGWHYALTGGILVGLSPYGFEAMNGRYGYLADSARGCAAALARLRLILGVAGIRPDAVALLPDRSSRILGAAAATLLGVPVADFDPARPAANCLVVAYDLTQADPDAVAALRERQPGQVLFERAACWAHPSAVTADVSGLLAQIIVAPWDGQIELRDGAACEGPPDDRPIEAIAADIAAAEPEQAEGDGGTPPDPDEWLRGFAEGVAGPAARGWGGGWLGGLREYVPHAGPVPSSRFW